MLKLNKKTDSGGQKPGLFTVGVGRYTPFLLRSFNGPEPGGPESTMRKWKKERG